MPVNSSLTTAFYAAPQFPDDAQRLFEAGCRAVGLGEAGPPSPLPANRGFASALVLAREWGMSDLEAELVAAIEASYEPTWDTERAEFTWGMGLGEPHPRGQYNAYLATAEAAGPGRWTALSAAPIESCPQIVGVDFPSMALSRAEWVGDALHLSLAPMVENPRALTEFRLVGAEPRLWFITGIDNAMMDTRGADVVFRVPMVSADMVLMPGIY